MTTKEIKKTESAQRSAAGDFFQLQATERDQTLTPRQLRTAGFLPATLYGKKGPGGKQLPSLNVQVRDREFSKAYKEGNRTFQFAGLHNPLVRVSQLQIDPVSQKVLNVEFMETTTAEAKALDAERAAADHEAEVARQALSKKLAEEAASRPAEEEPATGATPATTPAEKTKAAAGA